MHGKAEFSSLPPLQSQHLIRQSKQQTLCRWISLLEPLEVNKEIKWCMMKAVFPVNLKAAPNATNGNALVEGLSVIY